MSLALSEAAVTYSGVRRGGAAFAWPWRGVGGDVLGSEAGEVVFDDALLAFGQAGQHLVGWDHVVLRLVGLALVEGGLGGSIILGGGVFLLRGCERGAGVLGVLGEQGIAVGGDGGLPVLGGVELLGLHEVGIVGSVKDGSDAGIFAGELAVGLSGLDGIVPVFLLGSGLRGVNGGVEGGGVFGDVGLKLCQWREGGIDVGD